MMKRSIFRRSLALPLMLVALFATACENPIGEGGHPAGIVVLDGQTQVAGFALGAGVTGRVTVPANGSRSFRLMLTDVAGNRIAIDGLEYSIRNLNVVLTPVATAALEGVDGIRVTGRTAGTTSLNMQVWHGNHEEFTVSIPLVVQ